MVLLAGKPIVARRPKATDHHQPRMVALGEIDRGSNGATRGGGAVGADGDCLEHPDLAFHSAITSARYDASPSPDTQFWLCRMSTSGSGDLVRGYGAASSAVAPSP